MYSFKLSTNPIGMALFGPLAEVMPLHMILIGSGVMLMGIAAVLTGRFIEGKQYSGCFYPPAAATGGLFS